MLLGAMSLVRWGPPSPRVNLKEGKEEARAGKLGRDFPAPERWVFRRGPPAAFQQIYSALEDGKLAPRKRERRGQGRWRPEAGL